MTYEAPDTPPPYRSMRDAFTGVHDVNAEASVPGSRLDGKVFHVVCQAIRFLGGYYGPTLTENITRVTPESLARFKAEVDEAVARIDRTTLSFNEKIELSHALEVMMKFKSAADE